MIAIAGAAQQLVPSDYRLPPRSESADGTCEPGRDVDVVVCGRRRPSDYRVVEMPGRPSEHLMRRYGVGRGVTVEPEISQIQHESGPWAGMVDRRVTVSVRVPF